MLAIIIFIVILGVLVFVHELGHFVVARRNGIKAEEFGFGFPPRIFGFVKNEESGKYEWVFGNKDVQSKNTIYSVNWIPLGGFVKIKGENGTDENDVDSFSGKSAWSRIKVLAAGVIMNFVLAWALIAIVFMIGAPQTIDPASSSDGAKIQIAQIVADSPAEKAGIKVGDEILPIQRNGEKTIEFSGIESVQEYVAEKAGEKISLQLKRGNENLEVNLVPRKNAPEGEGPLGVALAQTEIVRYSFFSAIWEGFLTTLNLIAAIFVALVGIIKSLFMGQGVGADVAGPVGIAVLTKQVSAMGLVYILQFAALISINLGIINILPIPALDGGRILFVLIEKIKGSPVSQKVEQAFHSIFFALLIILLILITFRDIGKFIK